MTRLIPTHEFALYSLGGPDSPGGRGEAAGGDCLPFSPVRYSRYKYGSMAAAEDFAQALGTAFGERHPELARAPRLLMASSPYAHVPAAATTLARRLQPRLNAARARYGLAAAPLLQVDRVRLSAGDYGVLSARARSRLMAGNALSFRRFAAAQLRDAHLLIVDDVRVTGAHQRCVMRATEKLPIAARTFLYIASFKRPADGRFDPTGEDALNHAAVKTLDDLAAIVESGDFAWNVRVCKFVLSPANIAELPRFLRRMPGWFIRGLLRNSRQDGYARMDPYAASHALVRAELGRRSGQPAGAGLPRRQPV